MLKPIGKYLKARKAGCKAHHDGIPLDENPNQHGSNIAMAAWWDKGWHEAREKKTINEVSEMQKKVETSVIVYSGEYTLQVFTTGKCWLQNVDGEGMELNMEQLENMLREYMEENFS